MASAPTSGGTPPVPEPPPPLGSWPRFYALIALYHVLVVLTLWLLTHWFQLQPLPA